MQRRFSLYCCLIALMATALPAWPEGPPLLPELGDASSALVSTREERQLGQAWLQVFRSQAPIVEDPLLQDYLEHLIYDLASHSALTQPNLSVVIIDNKTINAFAVPGGIVGIHNGLILQAEHEDELASVLAHELAHLSQRHFVRGLEAAQRQQIPAMAGLLAGILLAATAGPDAGMAAIAATQAASMQSQLRYSRQNEQEADRIGMQTLYDSDRDPFAFVRMFEIMQRSTRLYGPQPPEFLLTHPITESRIADARNRAAQLSGHLTSPLARGGDDEYQLMRARVRLHFAETPSQAVRDFRSGMQAPGAQPTDADYYGLALALLAAGQASEARDTLAPLLAKDPSRLAYTILQADIEETLGEHDAARKRLENALSLSPGNHPLTMVYANLLQQQGRITEAITTLKAHSYRRPAEPQIWYRLAELYGLAGRIMELHQARAEYFILTGHLDEADQQLQYALRLAAGNGMATAVIQQRQQDVAAMRTVLKSLG